MSIEYMILSILHWVGQVMIFCCNAQLIFFFIDVPIFLLCVFRLLFCHSYQSLDRSGIAFVCSSSWSFMKLQCAFWLGFTFFFCSRLGSWAAYGLFSSCCSLIFLLRSLLTGFFQSR
ncbi:hypothetical protein BRADI_1g42594v3 [Brachypodium distachyon]|uniref:Transmembrane protein n=1 Tax=Brachypodium distachyon TaxID=15368 RepID=A0A0Q3K2F3_BRADI|nr:hypothetical protein BRADI_1g42594v3 [Brachypodium distachyon]